MRPDTAARRKARLKAAFAIKVSELLVKADGRIADDERAFLAEMFPADLLGSLGLDDPERYERLRAEALEELPALLDHEEKLQLIGLFLAVSDADAHIDVRELEVIAMAADQLGVPFDDVIAYTTTMMSGPT